MAEEIKETIQAAPATSAPEKKTKVAKPASKAKTKATKKQETRQSEADQLRSKDVETIESEIADLKKELFNLRFQSAVGKLKDTSRIAKVRKGIARRLTILTERANGINVKLKAVKAAKKA